jgi:hypothetical protein
MFTVKAQFKKKKSLREQIGINIISFEKDKKKKKRSQIQSST